MRPRPLAPDATSYTDAGLESGDYHYTLATIVVEDPTSPTLIFFDCVATISEKRFTNARPVKKNIENASSQNDTSTSAATPLYCARVPVAVLARTGRFLCNPRTW